MINITFTFQLLYFLFMYKYSSDYNDPEILRQVNEIVTPVKADVLEEWLFKI